MITGWSSYDCIIDLENRTELFYQTFVKRAFTVTYMNRSNCSCSSREKEQLYIVFVFFVIWKYVDLFKLELT